MMVVAGLILTGGWRRILRVQATLFWMVTGSLVRRSQGVDVDLAYAEIPPE
jgi:hypothetical protein